MVWPMRVSGEFILMRINIERSPRTSGDERVTNLDVTDLAGTAWILAAVADVKAGSSSGDKAWEICGGR